MTGVYVRRIIRRMTARTAAVLDHYARPVAPASPSWAELSRRLGRARDPLATVDHYVRAA